MNGSVRRGSVWLLAACSVLAGCVSAPAPAREAGQATGCELTEVTWMAAAMRRSSKWSTECTELAVTALESGLRAAERSNSTGPLVEARARIELARCRARLDQADAAAALLDEVRRDLVGDELTPPTLAASDVLAVAEATKEQVTAGGFAAPRGDSLSVAEWLQVVAMSTAMRRYAARTGDRRFCSAALIACEDALLEPGPEPMYFHLMLESARCTAACGKPDRARSQLESLERHVNTMLDEDAPPAAVRAALVSLRAEAAADRAALQSVVEATPAGGSPQPRR